MMTNLLEYFVSNVVWRGTNFRNFLEGIESPRSGLRGRTNFRDY